MPLSIAIPREFSFAKIPLAAPQEAIWRRLGFRKGQTHLDEANIASFIRTIAHAQAVIALGGVAKILPVLGIDENKVHLDGGIVFESAQLAAFLAGTSAVLMMGATAGAAIIEALEVAAREDLSKAVIYDATASEMVDGALAWMQSYISAALRRTGYGVGKRRFSAGYGDFDLRYQQVFYEELALDKLGISLTPHFMLTPEKSVTALCAIDAQPLERRNG